MSNEITTSLFPIRKIACKPTLKAKEIREESYIVINQQYAAVRSQFYFTAGSLYMFRVLSTNY